MQTLDEYNTEFRELSNIKTKDRAGVLCPICKGHGDDVEMILTTPGMILLTSPGQQYVHCPRCGYKSTKYC